MLSLSIVQGRLSAEIAGKYQHFPINNWRNEFFDAKRLGFIGIEWIISDFSNPIFDKHAANDIIRLVKTSGVKITSISLDLLMTKTIDQFDFYEIEWMLELIDKTSKSVGLKRVSFPIEETSGIRSPKTMEAVVKTLKKIAKISSNKNYKLSIETDLSALSIHRILNLRGLNDFGIVLDIGNSAANGFKLIDYFNLIPKKIFGIHIKDRKSGCGPTVKLGTGSAEFNTLKENFDKLVNLEDITLQAFRSKDNFIEDAITSKNFVDNVLNNEK